MASLVRIGLVVLLTLAPALCCCQARWLTASAAAGVSPCCQPVAPAPKPVASCCPHCLPETDAPEPEQATTPATPQQDSRFPHCQFCDAHESAITTDPQPRVEAPAFAGELLPAFALFAAAVPAHRAFQAGIFPSERTGVDARSAALFDRHVLRC